MQSMEEDKNFVPPVGLRYATELEAFRAEGTDAAKLYSFYTKENLENPFTWYRALAVCEYALDMHAEAGPLLEHAQFIFRGYDCVASVYLDGPDYDWLWHKIHQLLDRLAPLDVWAVREKGMQYYTARREYKNKEKALQYLEQAAAKDEYSGIIYGYYLFGGFCGKADTEQGRRWVENVSEEKNRVWSDIYRGYMALMDKNTDEAARIAFALPADGLPEREQGSVWELQGVIHEVTGETEKAEACFSRAADTLCSSLAWMRLGLMCLNEKISGATVHTGMELLEKAFRFGRYEAANLLAYYYNPENGKERSDREKYRYWLEKGFLYGISYCAFMLSHVYLYDETNKSVEKGLFYLDYAVSEGYEDAVLERAYLYFNGTLVPEDKAQAVKLLEQAVTDGSGYAAYRLGLLYEQGELGGEPDYKMALAYFEKSAALDCPAGCDLAGRSYRYGYAGEPDWEKARSYFEKGLEAGSSFSAVELAFMYERGEGVEADLHRAYELYQQAAGNDYPYAMLRLGIYEENGTVGEERPGVAFEWYVKASEGGNAEAMGRLGWCYKYAYGTEENPDKAFEWFEKGTAGEDVYALAELAWCYENAYGTEEDMRKAITCYTRAAEMNFAYAQYKMGYYRMHGCDALEEDHPKALEWFGKAIENGNAQALVEMGDYYLYDYDDTDQYDNAFPYYKQALEKDLVTEGLGYCLFFGYGVESNEPEAFKYFLMAAERGYVRAMYRTGLAYYYGWGIKENKEEAFRWFNEGAQNEQNASRYYLGKMLIDGEGCTADVASGVQWLRQSAEEGDADAQYEMGNCYLLGRGVDENPDTAWDWFEKAADNGHEQSMKVVGRRKRK